MTALANLDAAYAIFQSLPAAAKEAGAEMLHEIGTEAQQVQRALTPVDTGLLQSSNTIAEAVENLRVRIGYPQLQSTRSPIWYAIVIEYGRKAGSKQVQGKNGKPRTVSWGALPPRPFIHVDDQLDAIAESYAARFQDEVLSKVGAA